MEEAKTVAVVAAAIISALLLVRRKLLLDFSCTAVVFFSYVTFVCVGVLLAPWLVTNDYIKLSYSWCNFDLITESDLIVAIGVVLVGLVMFIVGHFYLDTILMQSAQREWGGLLRRSIHSITAESNVKLRLAFVSMLLVSSLILSTEYDAVISGLAAFFTNNVAVWYDARIRIGELGRLYFILIFNGLTFCSVALWLQYKFESTLSNRTWAYFAAMTTFVFLFLTFQKRPLLIFLICLFFANLTGGVYSDKFKMWMAHLPNLKNILSPSLLRKSLVFSFLLFGILVLFYKLTMDEAPIEFIMAVTFDRIFGRLSIMALMYSHYFPLVEPHYGLSNIGLFSSLLGTDLYMDTIEVPKFFDNFWTGEGSGAINALYDFYGAFGWYGVIFGSFGLGIIMNMLDRWLLSLPASCINRALYICMLVFSYHLSQASVPRSLSTYGGAFFLLVWFMFKVRLSDDSPVVLYKTT